MKFANCYKCNGYLLVTMYYVGEYIKVFLALKMLHRFTEHA
jgi:hypothetical protein